MDQPAFEPKGKTVSIKQMNDLVEAEYFYSGADAVGAGASPMSPKIYQTLSLMTFCILIMKNGFKVTGESACVDPVNYNFELGKKYARENAISKLWPILGYELCTQLNESH